MLYKATITAENICTWYLMAYYFFFREETLLESDQGRENADKEVITTL